MKPLRTLCLVLLAPGLMWAQASAPKAESSSNDTELSAELKALREALSQTQSQMASQQQEIEALRQQLGAGQNASVSAPAEAPQMINAALTLPDSRSASSYNAAGAAIQPPPQDNGQGNRPLGSFNIGGIEVTLAGSWIWKTFTAPRTRRPICHELRRHTLQQHYTGAAEPEYRLTGQYSRLDVDAKKQIWGQ